MGKWQNWTRNARAGERPDLPGISWRSSWEPNYARVLNRAQQEGWIAGWRYEPTKFRFPDRQFKNGKSMRRKAYIPDFEITRLDGTTYFIEVKGWVNADALRKQRLMAEFYPDVMVITIGPEQYRDLERGWRGEVAWEIPGEKQRAEQIEL